MIQPNTLDEAIIEAHRFIKAAKALRARQREKELSPEQWRPFDDSVQHAAALRASMDLTRKLADLRQSR